MKVAPKPKSKAVFPLVPRTAGKAGRPRKSPLKTKRSIAVMRYTRDIKLAAPWLEPCDAPLVRRFAELQVLIANLYFEIHSGGAFDNKRQPRFVLETYRRMVLAQAAIARELGLSPLARRQLALAAQGDDLAAAMARRVSGDDKSEEGAVSGR